MVKTVNDVVNRALLKLGVLRAGSEARAADAGSGLDSLSSYYMECVTGGAFGRVYNIPVSTAGTITAGSNQHINVLVDDTVTVDLPSILPMYYWQTWMPGRDYGWGYNVPLGSDMTGDNVPPDRSVVMVTDQFGEGRATYVYDGTIQRWMRIDTLVGTDEAPLSARNFDGLACVLATRMADEYGDANLSVLTLQSANRYRVALVTNHGNDDRDGRYEYGHC